MKVLFVTNMYPKGGNDYYGIHVKEQIDSLNTIEKQVYFINGRDKKYNYITSVINILRLLRSKEIDIVHIHFGLSGLFLLFTKKLKSKIIVTLHGSDFNTKSRFRKYINRSVLRKANKIIVVNDFMLASLNKECAVKIPCGINTAFFQPSGNYRQSEEFIIGFPGSPTRIEKNYKLFCDIISELNKQNLKIKVCVFDKLTRAEVLDSLNSLDLLLLTSTSEGSPQIIKEAMSCNIPIISTQVGDVKHLLDGVKNSFVIDSFEVEPFIQPVKFIHSLPKADRVSNGRDRIIDLKLDNISVANALTLTYNSLI
jgi:glycosyltransferase involved in cell wall biosynthesis